MTPTDPPNKVPDPVQPCAATTRQGTPCKNHPVSGKKRCRMHGGASTGPRTPDGRQRIAAAHLRHGRRRRSVIAEQKRRNRIGREIQAEIEAIEADAVARGWLKKNWQLV